MHWTLVRAIINLKRHAFFNQNQFSFSKPSAHITHYATKTLSDITAPHKTSYCFLVVVLPKTCKHTLMCKNVELPFNFLHVHVVLNSLDGYNFQKPFTGFSFEMAWLACERLRIHEEELETVSGQRDVLNTCCQPNLTLDGWKDWRLGYSKTNQRKSKTQ